MDLGAGIALGQPWQQQENCRVPDYIFRKNIFERARL
jgi:hypothetical protein